MAKSPVPKGKITSRVKRNKPDQKNEEIYNNVLKIDKFDEEYFSIDPLSNEQIKRLIGIKSRFNVGNRGKYIHSDLIEQSRRNKDISDYLISVLLGNSPRELSSGDEILRAVESAIPEIHLMQDIRRLRAALLNIDSNDSQALVPFIAPLAGVDEASLRAVLFPNVDEKANEIAPISISKSHSDKNESSPEMHTLPAEAPLKWKDHNPGETAPDFARRVYGPFGLADGISKRALRKLDAALVNELNTWVREGNEMPADIKVLTVREENDRLLNAGPEAIREHLGKFTAEEMLREAERLRSAQTRRR